MTTGNENIDCLFICMVSNDGTHNVIGRPQRNATTEKMKSKKSVAKSLTTDLHYITAENAKTQNNRKNIIGRGNLIFTFTATETKRFMTGFWL